MQNLYWLADNPASGPYHSVPLSHAGATAAAVTGSGGPSPRVTTSKRHETRQTTNSAAHDEDITTASEDQLATRAFPPEQDASLDQWFHEMNATMIGIMVV